MTKRKYRIYKLVMKSASKPANCYITLIKDMELLILLKLKWDIMVPTSKDFLLVLIKKLQQRKIVKNDDLEGIKTHANTFIDLILLGESIRRTLILWLNRVLQRTILSQDRPVLVRESLRTYKPNPCVPKKSEI